MPAPVLTCDAGRDDQLMDMILKIYQAPEEIKKQAEAARYYYQASLSNEIISQELLRLLSYDDCIQ